eukprot:CAMPEP_0116145598 /NCGR_PEP_ID=MMETSP0329-20121206/16687_1 /TAXON_ID=697910 /ORGANISM="Pseudo-nitzschia arenysensis, Strain B593" /LENGTH=448 /DNA_ID=CAMNT_0003641231 /DNA_START=42 /DNA_END=1388 /DNA_ORIENTATION=-
MKDEPPAKRRQVLSEPMIGTPIDGKVDSVDESSEKIHQCSSSSSFPSIPVSSSNEENASTPVSVPTTETTEAKRGGGAENGSKGAKVEGNSHIETDTSTPTETKNDVKEKKSEKETSQADRTSKDYYFDSYAHHAIHEEMLKDEVRTRTYEMAIKHNEHLFRDKIVLDVGCGTGILSMFASQVGAKHVYAVDCSSIAIQARQIVEKNGFGPDKITVIQGKIEEIELPVAEVDVIVSEWMGYFLLYESMLDTVIYARDKWLVKDGTGIVFPDKAVMYMCAIEDGQVKRDRIDFWENVYGFDMTPIQKIALKEPVVDVVDSKAVVSDAVPILHLDILTCKKEDVEFSASFELTAKRNDYVHGLVAYFECAFTQVHKPIGFSTSPFCRYTHWKQTIFYLPDNLIICDGEKISGDITCKPNTKNRRDLDIGISIAVKGRHNASTYAIDYRLR